MFLKGDKVIFHGDDDVNVPIGAEGVVENIDMDGYIVYFDDHGLWGCNASSLSYGSFLLNDRVKIIGPVSGMPNNEFFGFEGTVAEIRSKKVIRVYLEITGRPPLDLFVETSSLERIESGSRWWV